MWNQWRKSGSKRIQNDFGGCSITGNEVNMKEAWKRWIEKKGIRKWFQRDNFIILILSGVLLFIIALPTKETGEGTGGPTNEDIAMEQEITADEGEEGGGGEEERVSKVQSLSQEDYCAYLEEKLKNTLSGVSGVGNVQVMITLKSSEELVVEKDTPISRSNTTEQDSQGGSRTQSQVDSSESTVYKTQGNDSEPYVVKTLLPEVEGVVVVAQGAGSGTVNKSITEIVQALFDLEAHKVKVVKMKNDG
nr:stage III sporulation protein AG [uncultured Acetatifactor sp.]